MTNIWKYTFGILIFYFTIYCRPLWNIWNPSSDRYYSKLFSAGAIGVIGISYGLYRRYGYLAGICFAYTMGLTLFRPYAYINDKSIYALFSCLLTVCPFLVLKEKRYVQKILALMCAINTVFSISVFMFTTTKIGLLDGNTSMNACTIAFLFPFYFKEITRLFITNKTTYLIMACPVVAILLSGETMPFIVLSCTLAGMFLTKRTFIKLLVGIGIIGLLGYGLSAKNNDYFSGHGRVGAWKFFMHNWKRLPTRNIMFGTGTGTFFTISQKWQNQTGFNILNESWKGKKSGYYIFLHSDILQSLFEQGLIGLMLYLSLAATALIKAYKSNRIIFASFIGVLATSTANYPFRLGIIGLVCTAVLWLCLCKDNDKIAEYKNIQGDINGKRKK